MAEEARFEEPRPDKTDSKSDTSIQDLPPDEQFWEKYSRNYEFPLSTFGAIAAHIVVVGFFILYVSTLLNSSRENTSPPIRTMLVAGDGEAAGDGSDGSAADRRENPMENPIENHPPIPDAKFQEVQSTVQQWTPDLNADPELVEAIASSKEFEKLKNMSDSLRKKLVDGMSRGKGIGSGMGDDQVDGQGKSGRGTGNTTGERSLRWSMKFNNIDLNNLGRSYLDQLASLNAKIILANPPNGTTFNIYTDLTRPNPGAPFTDSGVREMWFIESQPSYVQGVAQALGANFVPNEFIVIFPKEIEEKMADLEIQYARRNPMMIESTTFQFHLRDGKPVITVQSQTAKRR